jgi:Ca2+-binding RTX toxin-like protein
MSANDAFGLNTLETSGAVSETYSPDQTRLYVSKDNGDLDVFDVVTHEKIATWDIGQTLGAASVSEDGTFLLTTDQHMSGTLYKVNTSTGAVQTFSTVAGVFGDVEIVDANTALITGGAGHVTKFDIATSTFSPVSGGVDYSNSSVIVQDGQYVLLAEPGISNGPLFVYDTAAGAFVASGDDYQSPVTGFNWGSQAISAKAGMIAQFIYYGSINIYDLNVHYTKNVYIGERIDGMVFNDDGTYAYIYLIDSGAIAKFDTSTWTKVAQFSVGTESWNNYIGYGDQLLVSHDEKYITVMDSSGVGKLQLIDLTLLGETLYGSANADTLTGSPWDDTLIGGGGVDTMNGGEGSDLYIINVASEHSAAEINDTGTTGTDEVRFTATTASTLALYAGDCGIELVTIGTGTDASPVTSATTALNVNAAAVKNGLTIIGNAGANTLTGTAFSDRLDGGAGADIMLGGAGNDTYVVNNIGDKVYETTTTTSTTDAGGTDTVEASISYTLGNFVENLTLTGSGNINGTGNALNNVITGNAGNNVLDGKAGADTLDGGDGSDIYLIDQATDYASGEVISDSGTSGTDEIRFAASAASTLTLSAQTDGIERVVIGTGTAASAVTTGTVALNVNASAVGSALEIDGNAGANILTGTAYDDTLNGGAGNDRLDGGAGADTLIGGTGNDTYVVDNPGDTIIETSIVTTAIDTVEASLSWTLGDNLENLTLTGSANIDATGNALNNTLKGNSGNNRLDGGAGADVMLGGAGNDTYVVDNIGDKVYETTTTTSTTDAGGTDTVEASISYTLGSFVENLTLTGSNAINGTGNGLANVLIGNGAANVLYGKGGIDTMDGRDGSDIYLIGSAAEHPAAEIADTGTTGTDEVRFTATSAGTLTLYAGDTGIEKVVIGTGTGATAVTTATTALNVNASAVLNGLNLIGNAGANLLVGTAYADTLIGGNGNDVLTGGDGADKFVFNTTPNASSNRDTITDFQSGTDVIQLSKTIFTALGGLGTLASEQFWSAPGALAGHDADDCIVYSPTTGALYYDADGNGSGTALQIALLGTTIHPALAYTDIQIIV